MQRQLFICSAVETCQEQSQCCPHKQPHIKDERCIPKLCRYGPRDVEVDCVPADPVNPHVPKAKPAEESVKPARVIDKIDITSASMDANGDIHVNGVVKESHIESPVKAPEEPTKKPAEVTLIHDPDEKKSEPAQRPVTLRKKPGRKAAK